MLAVAPVSIEKDEARRIHKALPHAPVSTRATSGRSCSAALRLIFVRQARSPEPAADGGGRRTHPDAAPTPFGLDLDQ